MAISDEKRREIAARLRGVTEEELRSMFLGEILDCAIGGRCLDDEGDIDERLVLNRLADLIDRHTCKPKDRGIGYVDAVCDSFCCPNCGFEIDVHIGEEQHLTETAKYCPECGAEVVNDD